MGLIESIIPLLRTFYALVLVILIYLGIRAVYSHFHNEVEFIDSTTYKKGPTEYHEPPRPHSPKFKEFVNLATLSGSKRQRELVKILSQSLQNHFSKGSSRLLLSRDACDLIDDPNKWINAFYHEMETLGKNSPEYLTKELSNRIISILEEVSTKLNLGLELSDEWK